jgi:2-phospho-L-lactate guanylyltransferase
VPFKGPVGSKRRLAGLLDEDERVRLSLAMLDGVLDALLGAPVIERVLLLRPHAPRMPSDDIRLTVVEERLLSEVAGEVDNLNGALAQAQALAKAGGADALLIVPADLPLLTSADVGAVLDAGESASVVIAPDCAVDGTNALLLAPPGALVPSFGIASFARHRDLAGVAGAPYTVIERPGLGLDLDTPADVSALLACGQDCRASRLLRELGVPDRLERLATAQARSTTI